MGRSRCSTFRRSRSAKVKSPVAAFGVASLTGGVGSVPFTMLVPYFFVDVVWMVTLPLMVPGFGGVSSIPKPLPSTGSVNTLALAPLAHDSVGLVDRHGHGARSEVRRGEHVVRCTEHLTVQRPRSGRRVARGAERTHLGDRAGIRDRRRRFAGREPVITGAAVAIATSPSGRRSSGRCSLVEPEHGAGERRGRLHHRRSGKPITGHRAVARHDVRELDGAVDPIVRRDVELAVAGQLVGGDQRGDCLLASSRTCRSRSWSAAFVLPKSSVILMSPPGTGLPLHTPVTFSVESSSASYSTVTPLSRGL